MASRVTYLLVSDPDDPEAVRNHPAIDEAGFEYRASFDEGEGTRPALQFVVGHPIDDLDEVMDSCRALSAAFPAASVVVCEVEERFDQVERLKTKVFRDGDAAGEIEHGYVYNIGSH